MSCDSINNDATTTLNNLGTLTLKSIINAGTIQGAGTYNLAKSISNSGTFTASTATLNLNGSSAQTINASLANKQLYNLIITNSSGVTLTDSIGILNTMSFGNVNSSTFSSNGYLVIKSSSSNTGIISDITNNSVNSGNTITGNVSVERYIPANSLRGYRYIAPSVTTSTSIHANWQEGATSRTNNPHPGYGTHITGSITDQSNGFDGSTSAQASLYRYDVASNNFIAFANTNVLTLNALNSYLLYFRGDRSIDLSLNSEGSTNTIIRASGTVLTGTQTFSGLVGTGNANGGFNLIPNPYAAPISWTKIYAGNTGIAQYYTYYDNRINGGSYVTVDNTGVTSNVASAATIDIQSGEAFWIQASGTTAPTLNILETYKTSTNNVNVFKSVAAPAQFYTSLYINDNLGRRNADGILSRFDGTYSNNIDNSDADELENFNENIAINKLSHHLSIEGKPMPTAQDTIFLYMSNMNPKNYQFQFNATNIDHNILSATLVDNYNHTKTPINFDTATVIPFSVSSAAGSSDTARFYILLNPVIVLPVTLSSFKGYQKEKGIELEWATSQELNVSNYQILRSKDGSHFEPIGMVASKGNSNKLTAYNFFDAKPLGGLNYYKLKITDKNGKVSNSDIIKVIFKTEAGSLTVFPNPVHDNKINLKVDNIPEGNYVITVSDHHGRIVYSKALHHSGGDLKEEFKITQRLVNGVYVLQMGSYKCQFIVL